MIVFFVVMYFILTYLVFVLGVDMRDKGCSRLGAWMILTCWLPVVWIVVCSVIGIYYVIKGAVEAAKSCGIDSLKTLLKDAFGRRKV